MNEEEIRKKQKEDLERILALALIKNLYNQGKISEFGWEQILWGISLVSIIF